jgi:hypothetical protein
MIWVFSCKGDMIMKIKMGRQSLSRWILGMLCLSLLLDCQLALLQAQVTPLDRAHAHNDYAHQRPLLDALDAGFCSVEADVYLVDGDLWVAHDREDLKSTRRLTNLYLDPLLQRARNYGGRIYPDGPEFHLMIDFKSEAEETYRALRNVLKDYQEMLTEFGSDGVQKKAVTIVISGNRPTELLASETHRLAFIDGRFKDMDDNKAAPDLIPWISENWMDHFVWNGRGTMTEGEEVKLKHIIGKAHEQGRKIRFWSTPETGAFWRKAHGMGVDFINTDRLKRLRSILLEIESSQN